MSKVSCELLMVGELEVVLVRRRKIMSKNNSLPAIGWRGSSRRRS
jgi:hypothetical protein